MKIRPSQILAGVSLLAYFLANFLFVVNWIVQGYGNPGWELGFWVWPISFVIESSALLIFAIAFNTPVFRYSAVGLFIFCRLIYSFYWMNLNDESVTYLTKLFISWPYWGSYGLGGLANVIQFLSFILFVIGVGISFVGSTPAPINTVPAPRNMATPPTTFAQPAQIKKAPGQYSDIEVLGDLLAKGLITEEEFQAKKKQILGL